MAADKTQNGTYTKYSNNGKLSLKRSLL